MTYKMVLPIDPATPPSPAFGGSTHEFELTPAFWFGLTLCDDESHPEGTKVCRPDSDSNVQVPPRPDHAGAAFMELQLYPPGYPPELSCDRAHWCAAMLVASLQARYGALTGPGSPPNAVGNENCFERRTLPFSPTVACRWARPVRTSRPTRRSRRPRTPY